MNFHQCQVPGCTTHVPVSQITCTHHPGPQSGASDSVCALLTGWINVATQVPEIPNGEHRSECVLVWAEDRVERAFFYGGDSWWLDDSDFDYKVEPTHWRPMLEPPIGTD